MPYIAHPSFAGPQEVEPFRALSDTAQAPTRGRDEAAAFGIQRFEDRDNPGSYLYLLGSQFVGPKTLLRRPVRQAASGETLEPTGEQWSVVSGGYAALRGAVQIRGTARPTPQPGQAMRTPAGVLIVDDQGRPILQPASGEPARDPETGELTGDTQP